MAVISGISPSVIRVSPRSVIAPPAPSVVPPGIVPAPAPTVIGVIPAISPIGIAPAVKSSISIESAPAPIVAINIDADARRVVPPTGISVIVVVIGQVIGLLTVGDGVIAHLAGIPVDIGEDLTVQNFADLFGALSEVVTVAVVFLLLRTYPFGIPLLDADHFVSAGVDAVPVIGGLLIASTRGQ